MNRAMRAVACAGSPRYRAGEWLLSVERSCVMQGKQGGTAGNFPVLVFDSAQGRVLFLSKHPPRKAGGGFLFPAGRYRKGYTMKHIRITRRSFLKAAALTASSAGLFALTGCGGSSSAANPNAFKVGIVNYVDDASLNQIIAAVQSRLDEIAAEKKVSFNYADFYANAQADQSNLNQIAADLVADQVDVIVAVATPTALVMQNAAGDAGIPVVYAAVSDPEGAGLTGLDNVTGTSDALDTASVLKLITTHNPGIKKLGLLYDLGQPSSSQPIADAKAFCQANGIEVVESTATNIAEVQMAAASLVAAGVEAVFTPTDNTIMAAELAIYETFIDAHIPHFTGADSFALNGAFLGYGVDYVQLGRATADLVAQVLVDGKTPGSIPYMSFDNGTATVNTDTAAALGYDMAQLKADFAPYCTQVNELVTAEDFE